MTQSKTTWLSEIRHGDCIAGMQQLKEGSVDLAFADPPFNIGYDYDVYDDKVEHQQYIDWCGQWIAEVYRALKPDGSFWLAIGDEYAAELKLESQKVGFHCRSWVIWYYTFGVNCKNKYTRSHAHLFYFVKDKDQFTFRGDDLENRVPSARELVYKDKRANPKGRLPDDTWIIPPVDTNADDTFVLRPQEIPESFQESEDTWYIPRVAGTFKERAGFHGCQMPEQLLGRIIRTCSEAGELVLDPFSGSATTLAVAKKMGRQQIGFDLSDEYVAHGLKRLESIKVGDPLDGSPEPTKGGKNAKDAAIEKARTRSGKRKLSDERKASVEDAVEAKRLAAAQQAMTKTGIVEAFRLTHKGFSPDRVVVDPDLNQRFTKTCDTLGLIGDAAYWNRLLFRLRKNKALAEIKTQQRTSYSWSEVDEYLFASEIAWKILIDEGKATSLDEILCSPDLAEEFDTIAARFSPGFTPLQYRWAALKIRKTISVARSRAAVLKDSLKQRRLKFGKTERLQDIVDETIPEAGGLYLLSQSKNKQLYAGETLDLRRVLLTIKKQQQVWESHADELYVQVLLKDYQAQGNLAWQSYLSSQKKTSLNCFDLFSA